jgi:septum formation protein
VRKPRNPSEGQISINCADKNNFDRHTTRAATMQPTSNIIYLASKSPRRRELLKQIGVQYELLMMRELAPRVDVDESPQPNETPHAYVERVVDLKSAAARRVLQERKLPQRPILTADTTVTFDGHILGKPESRDDAFRMLKQLSGETHQVLTAVMVATETQVERVLTTSFVSFAPLSDVEIRRYIDTGEPMDKAGAYGVQGRAAKWISKLSGSYSAVVGLPLYETAKLLRQCGVDV